MPSIVEWVAPNIVAYHWVGKVTAEEIDHAAIQSHAVLDKNRIAVYVAILDMRNLKSPPRNAYTLTHAANREIKRGLRAYIILGLPAVFYSSARVVQRLTNNRHIPARTWGEAVKLAQEVIEQ